MSGLYTRLFHANDILKKPFTSYKFDPNGYQAIHKHGYVVQAFSTLRLAIGRKR